MNTLSSWNQNGRPLGSRALLCIVGELAGEGSVVVGFGDRLPVTCTKPGFFRDCSGICGSWSCSGLDLLVVPAWSLKNKEVFPIGLVDCTHLEP